MWVRVQDQALLFAGWIFADARQPWILQKLVPREKYPLYSTSQNHQYSIADLANKTSTLLKTLVGHTNKLIRIGENLLMTITLAMTLKVYGRRFLHVQPRILCVCRDCCTFQVKQWGALPEVESRPFFFCTRGFPVQHSKCWSYFLYNSM